MSSIAFSRLRKAGLFFVLVSCASVCADPPKLVPPSAERMQTILDFAGPVSLERKIFDEEAIKRGARKLGPALAGYHYSDPARTSETFNVFVFARGEFMKSKRDKLDEWLAQNPPSKRTVDGRPAWSWMLAMGPGGAATAALLHCRDPRYELVVIRQIDFHDDEDPKHNAHHVAAKKNLVEAIIEIEPLMFDWN